MRGDALLAARLLLRPRGLAGLLAVTAGGAALASVYLPWHRVAADVVLLGRTETEPVAALAGWQAHPWNWVVPVCAVAAIAAGAGLALDHVVPHTRALLAAAGGGLAVAVAVAAVRPPPVARFDVAGSRLRELAGVAERLPEDVDLAFSVQAGTGLWLALAAAALLGGVALALAEPR